MALTNPKVLILGGGIAGLTAALALNRLNIAVDLIEKSPLLGGMVRNFCCKATEVCQQCGACLLNDTLRSLASAESVETPRMQIHLKTELREIKKEQKDFLYTFSGPGGAGEGRAEALVLATGFTPFRAEDKPQYRYGSLPNVVTGLELERQLKETGRFLKPSDQTPPKSIAFIQCVGSRDLHLGHPFCSQVCCGYALRMAKLLKYKKPETEITVFYMDIQNFGKDFPLFLEEARRQFRFIRAIPGDVQAGDNDRLILTYQQDDARPSQKEAFDLLVLSIGLMPGADVAGLSHLCHLPLTADGFLSRNGSPFSITSAQGIFMAGTVCGPKSIARSVSQAQQAAEEIVQFLKGGGPA
jgi:heterodisulfide reductase subunit A